MKIDMCFAVCLYFVVDWASSAIHGQSLQGCLRGLLDE